MSETQFLAPQTLPDALNLLVHEKVRPVILAGGTDLWPQWASGQPKPQRVLSLHRLQSLHQIELDGTVLRIGAACTHAELIRSELVRQCCPALSEAAATIGATQIQNQGTIGGNIVNASPAADLPPPLLAAGAALELASARGTRQVALDRFYLGYRQVEVQPDELVVAILLPPLPARGREHFRKIGTRRAQAISKVVGSCRLVLEPEGTIASAGIAFGSVAATPLRLAAVEDLIVGQRPGPQLGAQVEQATLAAVKPIDDLRSSAAYRAYLVGQLVRGWVSQDDGSTDV